MQASIPAAPWMLFIDGENLTIRAQALAETLGTPLDGIYHRDVYYWSAGLGYQITTNPAFKWHTCIAEPVRRYYYTCATGSDEDINGIHDNLQKELFSPVVIKKRRGKRAKGVDISLTKDMLVHAFFGHYAVAVLV